MTNDQRKLESLANAAYVALQETAERRFKLRGNVRATPAEERAAYLEYVAAEKAFKDAEKAFFASTVTL